MRDKGRNIVKSTRAQIVEHRDLVAGGHFVGLGGWGDADRIRTRKIGDSNYVVGDGRSEISAVMPPTAAIVGIAAAKQADTMVAAILNKQVGA